MRSLALLFGFLCMFSFPLQGTKVTLLPLLGFVLILFSVLRMEKMEQIFKKAKLILFIAIPISAVLLGMQIAISVGVGGKAIDTVYIIIRLLTELCEAAVMVFIYIGVKKIGVNAELPSLEKHSSRNMTLMIVYIIIYLAINILHSAMPSLFTGFEFVIVWPFILGYLWRAFNIWMAYTLLTGITVSKK